MCEAKFASAKNLSCQSSQIKSAPMAPLEEKDQATAAEAISSLI